ncbi:hypothetical protein [Methanococcus maripaludis]|uniref:Uncharacterized protein n=1 Tax=Methanococcus maripaludis TaxID=39152 RepID=A0A7J9PMG6_METMI|nr:hypothetical protein [Methanococcus maripaludis]MBA2864422.1 hypothetical protein [Methanococcus maripaludis]
MVHIVKGKNYPYVARKFFDHVVARFDPIRKSEGITNTDLLEKLIDIYEILKAEKLNDVESVKKLIEVYKTVKE